jgi:Dolichyl-phosphate-mannose-protein mannosyltransferase
MREAQPPEHTTTSRSIRHAWRFLWPLLPVLAGFLWIAFYGLNFGTHWDEPTAKFASIQQTLKTGVFVQGGETYGASYNYGGVNYLLTWAGFAPEVARFLVEDSFTREAMSARILPDLYAHHTRMRVRRIYLLVSALSIIWLYCLNLVLGRTRMEAFLGAAILAASWEFAYHSRWIAPDVVMAEFALLTFLCIAIAGIRKADRWFDVAAVIGGLAAGTKYPGALVVPFLVAAAAHLYWRQGQTTKFILKRSVRLILVAAAAFVITSPGVVIDPFRFFGELKLQRQIYAWGWFGHTVEAGIPHLLAILKYFFLELFSTNWPVSTLFAAFCVIGLISLGRERRALNVLVILFITAYLGYFSQQKAMIVRNLMVVVPFLCLCSARGIMAVSERFGPWPKRAFAAVLAILLVVSYGLQIDAAVQIKFRHHPEYFAGQFIDYVRASPSERVFISTKLSVYLQKYGGQIPDNLTTNPDQPHSKVAFLQTEGADVLWEKWPANWWGMYEANFGAKEVNLDAYPTFVGNERILLTSIDHFQKLPLTAKDLISP